MHTVFTLPERIDTTSCVEFEKKLFDECSGAESVTLDADHLEYISSAGLRVLLKLRKDMEVSILNVAPNVYDVFQTTGFDKLINIKKAFRKISVEGCEIVGRGITGTVYRLDSDTIAKVYDAKTSLAVIEQERALARTAFINGVPTAISYDVVRCGDAYGIVFELIHADTFSACLHGHPETFDHYAELYAGTLIKLHEANDSEHALPPISQKYHGWIDDMRVYLNAGEVESLHRMVNAIPERDTIIHGDFHPKNIMIQNGEPLLIDMCDVSRGNPIFDLAGIGLTHKLYAEMVPNNTLKFIGISQEEISKLWQLILRRYFKTEDSSVIKQKEEMIMPYVLLRYTLQPAVLTILEEEEKMRSVNAAREKLLPYIDSIIEKGLSL